MNPYELKPKETLIEKPTNSNLKMLKMLKTFFYISITLIFFTGCFKLNSGINITNTTTLAEMIKVSWFHGLFVFPMSWAMIKVHQITNSVFFAIVSITVINRLIGSAVSFGATIDGEKMKEIQPKMDLINNKYAGMKDRDSQIRKQTEMQALFKTEKINPLSALSTLVISFPLFLGIYAAVKDNVYLNNFTIFGVPTGTLTANAWNYENKVNIGIILVIFVLIIFQYLSMKIPFWLSDSRSKVKKIKSKTSSVNDKMAIFLPIMMLFVSWNLSIAILLYFTVSPVFTIIQSVFIHNYIIAKKHKK